MWHLLPVWIVYFTIPIVQSADMVSQHLELDFFISLRNRK